tara:strand:+ start:3561 stop:4691 length:1131 start_codon:yes stop_codon:yes gene_type:complete
MIFSIFATKDSWISSGSNRTTGVTETDQNFGKDQILEIKKSYFNQSFDYPTRALIQFDLSEISSSLVGGEISTDAKYFLRLFEAEGNNDLSSDYSLEAFPLSQSWSEGLGKFGHNPKVTNGCSWEYASNLPDVTPVSWSYSDGTEFSGGSYISSSGNHASQAFSTQSPDVEMDVTDIVNNWLGGANKIDNNGFLLKFSGSQETDTSSLHTGQLKFFSSDTHTIYAPRLEVRWDDHLPCTGSNTGSMTALNLDGTKDLFIYSVGMKEKYKEDEKIKFRFRGRERYIQKTFSTSVQTASGSYIPEGRGSYSIVDCATGDIVIPFSSFTSMSCDSTSPYFTQYLNTFHPDRVYKILLKLKYDDAQEQIFDEDFKFIVSR